MKASRFWPYRRKVTSSRGLLTFLAHLVISRFLPNTVSLILDNVLYELENFKEIAKHSPDFVVAMFTGSEFSFHSTEKEQIGPVYDM